MTELIGKPFKYKSKHGSSIWTGEIKKIYGSYFKKIGIGEPMNSVECDKGTFPIYKDYETKETYIILSNNNVIYDFDEIVIL